MGTKKRVGYRSSESGQFVKKTYAEKHPATTERQHIPTGGGNGRGGKKKQS
jgi:hypothetical protein